VQGSAKNAVLLYESAMSGFRVFTLGLVGCVWQRQSVAGRFLVMCCCDYEDEPIKERKAKVERAVAD
jgi:hypothetical protein